MVQSINWNNYSPNQIVELKNKGVEVPEEVYKNAEAQLSEGDKKEVTQDSSDAKAVSYSIKDDSGSANEAKELRQQLESEGESLKSIVKTFTQKSNEAADLMGKTMDEVQKYTSFISENQDAAAALGDQANDETQVVMEIVEKTEKEVQDKADELDFLNEKIEDGTASEDDQNKAQDLSEDIKDTTGEASTQIDAKVSTAKSLNSQVSGIQDKLAEVSKKTGDALINAKDGIELATETQDVSKKLYDKGKKEKTIAMAIGALAGAAGGFFAGKAVSNSMNNKALKNDPLAQCSAVSSVNSGQPTLVTEKTAQKMKTNSLVGRAGGAVAGAGLGLALGSLFGSSKMKTGQAGMDAAKVLNSVATQTKDISEKIAKQNDISIEDVGVAEVSVEDFDAAVSENAENVKEKGDEAEVAKAPETEGTNETGNAEKSENADDAKKKVKA